MQPFDYYKPDSFSEALRLKGEIPGARYIAGGTDLLIRLKEATAATQLPPALISLRSIPGLAGVVETTGCIEIGAMTPVQDLLEHAKLQKLFPALTQALSSFGGVQIRNAATLGGNLCNASPAADSAPPLMVYGARLKLAGPSGHREIVLDDWFKGPGKTALDDSEIVTTVVLDKPAATVRSGYLRKNRVSMDLALVGLAVALELEEDTVTCRSLKAVAAAVAPVPLRLTQVEQLLKGQPLDDATLARAAALAEEEVIPISDVRSSAGYRKRITGVFLKRLIQRLVHPGEPGGRKEDR